MPRDTQGNYSLPAGSLASTGETINVSQHNPPLSDLAAAVTQSLSRTGQGGMLAALNMNGNKLTAVAAGVAPGDVANMQQVNGKLSLDANGNVAIGLPAAQTSLVQIKSNVAAPNVRSMAIEHYAAGAGNWALDIHGYPGSYGLLGLHCYSDRNGDPAGAVAAKFDHTRNGTILALSNARNPVTSAGTTGTADFLTLSGFPDTSVSLATNPVVLAQWTYQNVILTPQNDWPLTVTGSGLVVNGLSNSPRGLVVTIGATGIYGGIVSGQDFGFAVATLTNGGQTFTVTKNGTGNGAAMVIKNEGIDPSVIGFTGVTQGFAIYANGDYYRGTQKVLGARGAAVANLPLSAGAPTQAEFNALVTAFNTLLDRLRTHGLIAP